MHDLEEAQKVIRSYKRCLGKILRVGAKEKDKNE